MNSKRSVNVLGVSWQWLVLALLAGVLGYMMVILLVYFIVMPIMLIVEILITGTYGSQVGAEPSYVAVMSGINFISGFCGARIARHWRGGLIMIFLTLLGAYLAPAMPGLGASPMSEKMIVLALGVMGIVLSVVSMTWRRRA